MIGRRLVEELVTKCPEGTKQEQPLHAFPGQAKFVLPQVRYLEAVSFL